MFSSRVWIAVVSLGALVSVMPGCATDGVAPGVFNAAPGARFNGSSEQGFLARVAHECAHLSVGEQQLGQVLEGKTDVRSLTLELYRGEMSNDEYVTRVLAIHPAPDGNVPATGCVIRQFDACTSGHCNLATAPKPNTPETPPAADANNAAAPDAI